MPSPVDRAPSLLRRLASMLLGRPEPASEAEIAARARWPHLRRGWLDPDVLLHGWRTTIDVRDARAAVAAVAQASGGRLGGSEVDEVVDFLGQLATDEPRAFRFGHGGPNAFAQIWIGLVRTAPGTVRVFLMGDQDVADAAQEALTVGRFAGPERTEYDELGRFFLAWWEWRQTEGPARLRGGTQAETDPRRLGDRMRRVLEDRSAPFLELLRGLRGRVRDVVERTRDLDPADVASADAFLALHGAPTLTEMRRRTGESA